MNALNILPSYTVSLLRSGQVLSCPSCVVKELVENSIDAGATNIEVRIVDYGLELIEVKDNGSGVAKEEIGMMTAPHCTSKITAFEDLTSDRLQTFGFRGEALNSLCSISDVEIVTKSTKDVVATAVACDKSGSIIKETSVAGNVGTTIRVSKLFNKIPVRRSFFSGSKSRKDDDFRKIRHLVSSYGIIRPNLRIVLFHNKKEIIRKNACNEFESSAAQILGNEIWRCLQILEFVVPGQENCAVRLFVPKNEPSSIKTAVRSSTEKIFCFVNDRPVVDKTIEKILKKFFPSDKPPMCIVLIKASPEDLDVNLEPSKQTVMIRCAKNIEISLENVLSAHYEVPKMSNAANAGNYANARPQTSNPTASAPNTLMSGAANFDLDLDDQLKGDEGVNKAWNSDRQRVDVGTPIFNRGRRAADFRTPDSSKSKRPRVEETNQPKLDFFWKEGPEIKNSMGSSDNTDGFVQNALPPVVLLEPGERPPARISLTDLPNVADWPENFGGQLFYQKSYPLNEPVVTSPSDKRSFERSRTEDSVENRNDQNPVSWGRGNCVTDFNGEVVTPVTMGKSLPLSRFRNRAQGLERHERKESNEAAWGASTWQLPFVENVRPVGVDERTSDISVHESISNGVSACLGLPPKPRFDLPECQSEISQTVSTEHHRPSLGVPDQSVQVLASNISTTSRLSEPTSFECVREQLSEASLTNFQPITEALEMESSRLKENVTCQSSSDDIEFAAGDFQAVRCSFDQLQDSSPPTPAKQSKVPNSDVPKPPKPEPNKIKSYDSNAVAQLQDRPTQIVSLDVKRLLQPAVRENHRSTKPTKRLIGQLTSGLWTFFDETDKSIHILNHLRIVEVKLFHQLMRTQALPSAPLLRGPIDLFSEPAWSPELTETLLQLAHGTVEITDPRMVLNGIIIQVRPGTERALLTSVARVVNFMDTDDVIEIVTAIRRNPNVAIHDCRPLKVKNYLMGEAVRMMRQSPPQHDQISVERLLAVQTEKGYDKCLHSRPISQQIFKLE